jgi:hypothetical protein
MFFYISDHKTARKKNENFIPPADWQNMMVQRNKNHQTESLDNGITGQRQQTSMEPNTVIAQHLLHKQILLQKITKTRVRIWYIFGSILKMKNCNSTRLCACTTFVSFMDV